MSRSGRFEAMLKNEPTIKWIDLEFEFSVVGLWVMEVLDPLIFLNPVDEMDRGALR